MVLFWFFLETTRVLLHTLVVLDTNELVHQVVHVSLMGHGVDQHQLADVCRTQCDTENSGLYTFKHPSYCYTCKQAPCSLHSFYSRYLLHDKLTC